MFTIKVIIQAIYGAKNYKYGTTDFVAWYRQFTNYCVAVGTEERHKYVLFYHF